MSRFKAKVTEVSIYMDNDTYVTTVTDPYKHLGANYDEVLIDNFHMRLFTSKEWEEISDLIAKAIQTMSEKQKPMRRPVNEDQEAELLKRREWVNLTDEEIRQCDESIEANHYSIYGYSRMLEAKIKEKNYAS